MTEEKQELIEEQGACECTCQAGIQPQKSDETGRRGGQNALDESETERGMDIYTDDVEA